MFAFIRVGSSTRKAEFSPPPISQKSPVHHWTCNSQVMCFFSMIFFTPYNKIANTWDPYYLPGARLAKYVTHAISLKLKFIILFITIYHPSSRYTLHFLNVGKNDYHRLHEWMNSKTDGQKRKGTLLCVTRCETVPWDGPKFREKMITKPRGFREDIMWISKKQNKPEWTDWVRFR